MRDARLRRHRQRQDPRRQAEREAQRAAAQYVEQARQRSISPGRAAKHLGIAARTLREWRRRERFDPFRASPRGRPPRTAPVNVRNHVIRFLHEVTGPAIGLPALRALFPQIPRCLLQDLLRRYRRAWRRRYVQRGFQLEWHRPGAVWAMDHSKALHPIDGVYSHVFTVRDLASHWQLTWQGVRRQTAEEALPILRELFVKHGAPLVLKSDNGSAFIAEITREAMLEQAVAQLFSPAHYPQYNAALERSNGTLKTYTHQHAMHQGHPFQWLSGDLEHARQLANTLSRPWGHRGPSPQEAWQTRPPIDDEERARFQEALVRQQARANVDLGLDDAAPFAPADVARRDRLALSRTLAELGYLTKTRVRRPPRKARRLRRDELSRRADDYRQKTFPAGAAAATANEHPMLASSPPAATMAAAGAAPKAPCSAAEFVLGFMPIRREWAFTSWLRRLFTPRFRRLRAAKIS